MNTIHCTASNHVAPYSTTTTISSSSATDGSPSDRVKQQPVRSGSKKSKMLAATNAQRQFTLHLYRAILSSHKIVLDPIMRDMGDTYVRDEFKRHKSAKPQYLQQFFEQWLQYLSTLKQQYESDSVIGKDLSEGEKLVLSEEQFKQFRELENESKKIDGLWESALDAAELAERTGMQYNRIQTI